MKWKDKSAQRDKLLDSLISRLEKNVKSSQKKLLEETVKEFLDGLQLDSKGNVKNTFANKKQLSKIDKVFSDFSKTNGIQLANDFYRGILAITKFNYQYYTIFENNSKLNPISKNVEGFVKQWLGINNKGKAVKNGYLDTLIENVQVRNEIKDFAMRTVMRQEGWQKAKSNLSDLLVGGKTMETGRMQQYYRNFVYDTYSQVDRASAKIYADNLKYDFASYEGGIIKTTRKFCKEHNGKIYHRSEIEKFNPEKAKPKNYNPFTDLGGYACRHHLNWIPDSLAFIMRPDAKQFLNK